MTPKIAGTARTALPDDQLPSNAYAAGQPAAPRNQSAAAAHAQEAPATRAPGLLTRALRAVDGTDRREKQRNALHAEVMRLQGELSEALLKASAGSNPDLTNRALAFMNAQHKLRRFGGIDRDTRMIRMASLLVGSIKHDAFDTIDLLAHEHYLALAYPSLDFSRVNQEDFVKTLSADDLKTLCNGDGGLLWQQVSPSSALYIVAKKELSDRGLAEQRIRNVLVTNHSPLPAELANITGDYVGTDYVG